MVDAITSAYDDASRFEWGIRKPYSWRKVVLIDCVYYVLTDIRHIRQIILLNDISRLHKTADGWTNRVSVAIHLQPRFIKSGIESRKPASRVVHGHVQLVSQSEIQRKTWRYLPVVLKKEVVINCTLLPITDAAT